MINNQPESFLNPIKEDINKFLNEIKIRYIRSLISVIVSETHLSLHKTDLLQDSSKLSEIHAKMCELDEKEQWTHSKDFGT